MNGGRVVLKKYLSVGMILGACILSACSEEKVEGEMAEVLPNGESKIMDDSVGVEAGLLESLMGIESELALVIANQTKSKSNDVMVMLSADADSEKKDNYILSCLVVLQQTDLTFDDESINNVVESIISTISTQDDIKATISSEDIIITNSNNKVLH